MAEKFSLEIVTPTRVVLTEEVETITAPGVAGEFGVLREHTLLITPLKPGEVTYVTDKGTSSLAIGNGYAEVYPEKTTLLVDSAEAPGEIDLEEAATRLRDSEEALSGVAQDDPDFRRLSDAHELARARVSIVEKAK